MSFVDDIDIIGGLILAVKNAFRRIVRAGHNLGVNMLMKTKTSMKRHNYCHLNRNVNQSYLRIVKLLQPSNISGQWKWYWKKIIHTYNIHEIEYT